MVSRYSRYYCTVLKIFELYLYCFKDIRGITGFFSRYLTHYSMFFKIIEVLRYIFKKFEILLSWFEDILSTPTGQIECKIECKKKKSARSKMDIILC